MPIQQARSVQHDQQFALAIPMGLKRNTSHRVAHGLTFHAPLTQLVQTETLKSAHICRRQMLQKRQTFRFRAKKVQTEERVRHISKQQCLNTKIKVLSYVHAAVSRGHQVIVSLQQIRMRRICSKQFSFHTHFYLFLKQSERKRICMK